MVLNYGFRKTLPIFIEENKEYTTKRLFQESHESIHQEFKSINCIINHWKRCVKCPANADASTCPC